jgi:hypothetical protein
MLLLQKDVKIRARDYFLKKVTEEGYLAYLSEVFVEVVTVLTVPTVRYLSLLGSSRHSVCFSEAYRRYRLFLRKNEFENTP